jgi:hypothetical protein
MTLRARVRQGITAAVQEAPSLTPACHNAIEFARRAGTAVSRTNAAAYFLLEERLRLLPDFLAVERFRPPDFRAELLFLLAVFLPELRFRLLPDFFATERFRLLPDFFAADRFRLLPDLFADVPFLLLDFRAVFLPDDVFLLLPDFFAAVRLLPLPADFFLPPLSCLLTVRQARSSASFFETPFFSYPSSMCSAFRFCLDV